jgi:hypothetical protein
MPTEQEDQSKTQDQPRYACYGRPHPSEHAMLVDYLDEYRCAEDFSAEYIGKWMEISPRYYVKGG